MAEPYVDQTGTLEKPNPMRDVYLEFPYAMLEVAKVTAMGTKKHAPRGWRTFEHRYALDYHMGKIGRHLLKIELEGQFNYEDLSSAGDPMMHAAQVAWNALAYLDHLLRAREAEKVSDPRIAYVPAENAR